MRGPWAGEPVEPPSDHLVAVPRPGLPEVLYLALADLEKKWERSTRNWSNVLGQFAVSFKDRLPNL